MCNFFSFARELLVYVRTQRYVYNLEAISSGKV